MLPTPMPLTPRRRGDNPRVPLPFVPPSPRPGVTLAQHVADRNDPHGTLKLLRENLDTFVTGGRFVPGTCRIELLHGDTVLSSIDASPFVKDGMVSSVTVSGGKLVIEWNSDSGAAGPTEIPLTDIFNPSNYYDKTSADNKFVEKEPGKRLMTDVEGTKLSGVETGAQKNVKPDWNAAAGNSAEILNKPSIPAAVDVVAPTTAETGMGKAADARATGLALVNKAGVSELRYQIVTPTPVSGAIDLQDRAINAAAQTIVTTAIPERWTWGNAAAAALAGFDTSSDPAPVWDENEYTWYCQGRNFYGDSGEISNSLEYHAEIYPTSISATVSDWNENSGTCLLTITAVDGVTLTTPEVYDGYFHDGGGVYNIEGPFRGGGGTYIDNYAGGNGSFTTTAATGLQASDYIAVTITRVAAHNEYSWSGATAAKFPAAPAAGGVRDFLLVLDVESPGQTGLTPSLSLTLADGTTAPTLYAEDGVDLAPGAGKNVYSFTEMTSGGVYLASRKLVEEVE